MIIVTAAAIGLILFVSFITARLIKARTAGMSIRMQIFLALSLIVGAFAFGLGLMVLDRVKARADLVGSDAARGEAQTVAALVAAEMEARQSSLQDVAQTLERYGRHGAVTHHMALLDRAGGEVFSTGGGQDEVGTVSAQVPVETNGVRVGYVRVVKPTLLIRQTLADFAPTVLIICLVLGAVAAGAAALIGRTIATPIEALSRFADQVSSGDLRAPPPQGHGREVMRLAHGLDTMRRALQGRPFVETFAADLSHELKNPVAAIRASAEVLSDGAIDDPVEGERFVSRILEATTRIEALLGDLLSLARLEARGVDTAKTIHLGKEAEKAVDAVRADGTQIELQIEGSVPVRGDATWLSRAIANLTDNARQHGKPGPIVVRLWRSDDEVCCSVTNPGEVSRGVSKRIFRRFVTTREDRGGSGLGLAIVRAIAEAHGGRAECTSLGPPEVAFQITLPAS
jgi:two-component system sensor histidine kinase CreC